MPTAAANKSRNPKLGSQSSTFWAVVAAVEAYLTDRGERRGRFTGPIHIGSLLMAGAAVSLPITTVAAAIQETVALGEASEVSAEQRRHLPAALLKLGLALDGGALDTPFTFALG